MVYRTSREKRAYFTIARKAHVFLGPYFPVICYDLSLDRKYTICYYKGRKLNRTKRNPKMKNLKKIKFTAFEKKVLAGLIAGYNGDFGFTEDGRSAVDSKAQLAGVVSSLVQKDIIIVDENYNDGLFTFVGINDDDDYGRLMRDELKKII